MHINLMQSLTFALLFTCLPLSGALPLAAAQQPLYEPMELVLTIHENKVSGTGRAAVYDQGKKTVLPAWSFEGIPVKATLDDGKGGFTPRWDLDLSLPKNAAPAKPAAATEIHSPKDSDPKPSPVADSPAATLLNFSHAFLDNDYFQEYRCFSGPTKTAVHAVTGYSIFRDGIKIETDPDTQRKKLTLSGPCADLPEIKNYAGFFERIVNLTPEDLKKKIMETVYYDVSGIVALASIPLQFDENTKPIHVLFSNEPSYAVTDNEGASSAPENFALASRLRGVKTAEAQRTRLTLFQSPAQLKHLNSFHSVLSGKWEDASFREWPESPESEDSEDPVKKTPVYPLTLKIKSRWTIVGVFTEADFAAQIRPEWPKFIEKLN